MNPRTFTNICRALAVLLLFAVLGSIYFFGIRPAQLRWGATPEECARTMPEDAAVSDPVFDATRAITIHATPEQIWPWLIQMGFGRAGFYGYDLIENLGSTSGIRSAQVIVPTLQNPHTGDVLPLSIAASLNYGPIQQNRSVVWQSSDVPQTGVFVWELVPIDSSNTRLISRIRWNYVHTPSGYLLGIFTEFTDHIAVRKILQGIRDRAEGIPPESLGAQAIEISSISVAVLNFLIALLLIGLWHRWIWAWFIALSAGLLLESVLYGTFSPAVREILPWLYFLGFVLFVLKFDTSRFSRRSIPW